ncbi:hypothetical protein EIB96_18330 [Vibrio parahaemolyticus]|nr:hypothetical protein [Vibrio parahaemolyticus]EGR0984711.1 hypothetical protein [Vibrio parahaemolyticus]EGR1370452.1 hypothetical protein [Vibrio parahaemolyticus]EGR1951987.1 hypothetical protein [Vibrio parahaemolyticus]
MIWILNFNAKPGCIDSSKRSFSEKLKFFCFFICFITIPFPNELFSKKSKKLPKEIRLSAVNKSNFERTTWFSETSETATSENQLEKSPWQ